MAFSISGYVLDKPRVGASNSPFTASPDNFISNQVDWDAAYPDSEINPNDDYLAMVTTEGSVPDARFGWTKNETIRRFDYSGKEQRFVLLVGSSPEDLGTLSTTSNIDRIKAVPPISTDIVQFPLRVSLSSGLTLTVQVVPNEAAFTSPPSGTVQLAQDTGTLNWNTGDLTTYQGLEVLYQRQGFRTDGTGALGVISADLYLAPLPATGQHPRIRIGFGVALTDVERVNEAAFSADPATGTVEWAKDTGRLKFNSADVAAGKTAYYEGVLIQTDLALPAIPLGTMSAPLPLWPTPPEGGDIVMGLTSIFPPGILQFDATFFVDAFTEVAADTVQIRRSDGVLAFNPQDVAGYGLLPLTAYVCDLPVDHGISLRLFRTPVDPSNTNPDVLDFTAYYRANREILASPIISAPFIFLPTTPVDTLPIKVYIDQGGGWFVSLDFPDLRTFPVIFPQTFGYILNYDEGQLYFAQKRLSYIIPRAKGSSIAQLPDQFIQPDGLLLELETIIPGTWVTLDLTKDAFLEPLSGVVTFTRTQGSFITSGIGGSIAGTTFTDNAAGLASVLAGDLLLLLTESAPDTVKGVYRIESVTDAGHAVVDVAGTDAGPLSFEIRRGYEVLADRYFAPVVLTDPSTKVERILLLGAITNSPRLAVPLDQISLFRIRYGKTRFSSTPVQVTVFSAPATLAVGVVEVDTATGELNFAQVDVTAGGDVYWARTLTTGVDFKLTAPLGFFEFTERMLMGEEGNIAYQTQDPDTGAPVSVNERMRFLIRKEKAQPRTTTTSVVAFNPVGREVAATPAVSIFRGGRPQDSTQVTASVVDSRVTFLPDKHLDGLLPHGNNVAPTETIYVDYYVYGAVGGEKTTSVLQPPMVIAAVNIDEDATSFQIIGDWTTTFKHNYMLRIEQAECHLIDTVVFAGGITTVSLGAGDAFRDKWAAPTLYLSSGSVPLTGRPYFVLEIGHFSTVARGTNKIKFSGDKGGAYQPGTIIQFNLGGALDYARVQGSVYNPEKDVTLITIGSNTQKQYSFGAVTIHRTIRPILDSTTVKVQTSADPVPAAIVPPSMQSQIVYSRITGERGKILTLTADYDIDPTGRITFQKGLKPNQTWDILYTSYLTVDAPRRLRATYVSIITPDDLNGLFNQTLAMDYSVLVPDTFYFRVVKMATYRQELAAQYAQDAKNSVPSSGPMLSNTGSGPLYKQGQPSVYYPEGALANEDFVGQSTLKYYNDAVNLLEDALQDMDGRLVGGEDQRFKYDGNPNNPRVPPNPATPFDWSTVTNQIDDQIKISDAPYTITFTYPTFTLTQLGTYVLAYTPSAWSRFFPTWQRRYGVTGAGVSTGDPVMDTGSKNLTGVTNLRTRLAWAITTLSAATAATSLEVDNPQGAVESVRPPFKPGMEVVILARDGTVLVPETAHIAISAVWPTSLDFAAPLPSPIPLGATVYRSSIDPFGVGGADAIATYRSGLDYLYDGETGQILYVKPFPPYDGTEPLVPAPMRCNPLPPGVALSCEVTLSNTLLAPMKIPALYGGATDDDGEVLFPVQSPTPVCELLPGYVGLDPGLVQDIRDVTTSEVTRTGNLDLTRTQIVITSGALLNAPQLNDIVRILDGLNGPSSFHRCLAGCTTTVINVDYPFDYNDTGFTVEVAAPLDLGLGAGTVSLTNTLTDVFATFQTWKVLPGHTVIVTSGVPTGRRLQVVSVIDENNLTFAPAISNGAAGYRISNALATYGSFSGTGTGLDALVANGNALLPILAVEVTAIEQFFDLVFTYLATGAAVIAAGTTLTDPAATFLTDKIAAGDVVYIRTGVNMGMYTVATVTSETVLDVDVSLSFPGGAAAYKIGRPFGVSPGSLGLLLAILKDIDTFILDMVAFQVMLTAPVSIILNTGVPDPTAFARGYISTDLDDHDTLIAARVASLTDPSGALATIEGILSGGDHLYDRRYTWIDSRINGQYGTRVKWMRAILERLRLATESLNAMTKLLAVQ